MEQRKMEKPIADKDKLSQAYEIFFSVVRGLGVAFIMDDSDRNNYINALTSFVNKLDDNSKAIIKQYYGLYDGNSRTVSEIAKEMGLPEIEVKDAIFTATVRLNRDITHPYSEAEKEANRKRSLEKLEEDDSGEFGEEQKF